MTTEIKLRPPVSKITVVQGNDKRAKTLLHIPAVMYLVIATQIPFLFALWFSLHEWNLIEPYLGKPFVGLYNYYYELTRDREFWIGLFNSARYVFASLGLALVGGSLLALLFNVSFPGRNLLRTLSLIPFLVTPAVAALVWKTLILDPVFGTLDSALRFLGFHSVDWISTYPMISLILITAWQWAPFIMLIVTAGLQSIPDEMYEAAKVDGAGGGQILWRLELPHLKHYYMVAILLGTLFIFQTFDSIDIVTSGGPGTQSTTLPFYIYQIAFTGWDIGKAATVGVFGVILSIAICGWMVRLFTKNSREEAV